MKTKTSRRAIWYKSLLVLPLLGVLIYSCSTNEIVEENPSDIYGETLTILGNEREEGKTQRVETITVSENINIRLFKNGGLVVNGKETTIDKLPERLSHINAGLPKETRKEMTTADIFIEPEVEMGRLTDVKSALLDYGVSEINVLAVLEDQDQQQEATPEMVEHYNKLAREFSLQSQKLQAYNFLRMKHIYSIMTPAQKKDAEEFPSLNPNQIITVVEGRQEERAAMKREREVVKEERKAVRREREAARAERQERQMERRQVTREFPPPPPPPVPQHPAPDKKLALSVFSEQEIFVNGRKTNLRGFAKSIDEATKNWTTADYNLHGLEIKMSEDVSEEMISRLNAEVRKTKLADYTNSGSNYFRPLTYPDSPPPPPKIESYLTEGSKIYLDGKIISAEKALELLKTKRDELKISIQQNGENNTIITMEQRE